MIEALGAALGALIVFVITRLIAARPRVDRSALMRELATRRGLAFEPAGVTRRSRHAPRVLGEHPRRHPARAIGAIDGLDVVVDTEHSRDSEGADVELLRVRVTSDLPPDVRAVAEGVGSFIARAVGGGGVALGDDRVDSRVRLYGDEAHIVARMNARARSAARGLLDDTDVALERGDLIAHSGIVTAAEADALLDRLLAFARAVRADRPLPELLAANAVGDPLPTIRQRNLELLVARFADAPATAPSLEAMLDDREPDLRLLAATLGDSPRAREALAAMLADDGAPPATRLAAAAPLAERAPAHPALAAHTPWLIAQLDGPEATAVLAADTLGHCGDLAVVEPLLAHTVGVFKDGRLKDAARAAIARVQARAGGTTGALSLAGADAGGISVVAPSTAPDPPLTEPTADPAPAPTKEALPWS